MDAYYNSVMGFQFNCPLSDSSDRCGSSNWCTDFLGPSLPDDDRAPALENTSLPVDHFDGVLRYLNQVLMEEDLEQSSSIYQDSLALDATENFFYDALKGEEPFSSKISDKFNYQEITDLSKERFDFAYGESLMVPSKNLDQSKFGSFQSKISFVSHQISAKLLSYTPSNFSSDLLKNGRTQNSTGAVVGDRKVNHSRDDDDDDGDDGHVERRSAKLFASSFDDNIDDLADKYDKLLLCPSGDPGFYGKSSSLDMGPVEERYSPPISLPHEPKRGRPVGGEKKVTMREVVDLSSLLTQCAECLAGYDNRRAKQLLNQIRQHSSLCGTAVERLAYCFANALEARISGIGATLYSAFIRRRVLAADTVKAYQAYFSACPFQRMSNLLADKTLGRLTREAKKIHIIDFGILHGFQWPCFIQGLSLRPGGPPKLRITGIDLPEPGFRPAKRVEETGRRIARYCEKFKIPFEYHGIAKKWETISLEDLRIDRSETVVVNCLYRLRHVPDETPEGSSPRDTVLSLINRINPEIFIHGILNGSYNAPFFAMRFREALFHFSALFDMFEKILPREDQDRLLLEKEFLGRETMNVIACEGNERIEVPETYKQWQSRNQRAGFRQLPLIPEIVEEVKVKVKRQYHKDFLVDEDSNWILQGWKGKIMYAISCWKRI